MSKKIMVDNKEYLRVDGIWFEYIEDTYEIVKNFEELELQYSKQFNI